MEEAKVGSSFFEQSLEMR